MANGHPLPWSEKWAVWPSNDADNTLWLADPNHKNFTQWISALADKSNQWKGLEDAVKTVTGLNSNSLSKACKAVVRRRLAGQDPKAHVSDAEKKSIGQELGNVLLEKSQVPWKNEMEAWVSQACISWAPRYISLTKKANMVKVSKEGPDTSTDPSMVTDSTSTRPTSVSGTPRTPRTPKGGSKSKSNNAPESVSSKTSASISTSFKSKSTSAKRHKTDLGARSAFQATSPEADERIEPLQFRSRKTPVSASIPPSQIRTRIEDEPIMLVQRIMLVFIDGDVEDTVPDWYPVSIGALVHENKRGSSGKDIRCDHIEYSSFKSILRGLDAALDLDNRGVRLFYTPTTSAPGDTAGRPKEITDNDDFQTAVGAMDWEAQCPYSTKPFVLKLAVAQGD